MSLYPTTLFHFTKRQNLYKILEDTFKPSYAREKIIGPKSNREFAVPMISFCDLKLHELKYFLSYGKYGIGLDKEWANRKGLTPVLYINRHSSLMDNFIHGIDGFFRIIDKDINENYFNSVEVYNNLMNTYRYIKNYEGELWRKGKLKNLNYRFADEREWRFVPDFTIENFPAFLPISKIESKEEKEYYNSKILDFRLTFNPEDIKYLIVKDESQILKLVNHLKRVKGGRFHDSILEKLKTRILTIQQIKNDI